MTSFQYAISKDIQRDVIAAANLYESCISIGGPLDAFINLAFLYWQSTEYGFNAAYNLPIAFIHKSGERYSRILDLGMTAFPSSKELVFWDRYFAFVSLGDDFSPEECEGYVEAPDHLIPYFFLRSLPIGTRYHEPADRLLQQCRLLPTLKNSYIVSVLESNACFKSRKR